MASLARQIPDPTADDDHIRNRVIDALGKNDWCPLGLTVIVVPDGFSMKASGGNVAAGCNGAGPGLAIPKANNDYDYYYGDYDDSGAYNDHYHDNLDNDNDLRCLRLPRSSLPKRRSS